MTVAELKEKLAQFNDTDELTFYVEDSADNGPTSVVNIVKENYAFESAMGGAWITFVLPQGDHISFE